MSGIPSGSNIPASATASLERLAVWSVVALQRANPRASVVEVSGNNSEALAQFTILQDDNDNTRIIVRLSVELDSAWTSDNTSKFWAYVKEISQTTIAPTFFG